MNKSNIFPIMIIVLILNAGISLVLINQFMNRPETHTVATRQSRIAAETDITRAVREVEPAVVNIIVTKTQLVRGASPFGLFFDFFDLPMRRQVQGFGSGVIYDAKEGYLITNAHVVKGATEIKVVLPDRRELDADIVKIDDVHDIAQLKLQSSANLPSARLGDSSDLIIGEWAIALGNPYAYMMQDYKPSVSLGVISALDRNFSMREDNRSYRGMIQTDAAINPGNSGGPLVDVNGDVIGINTFIFSENGGNVGIGFALPINTVKDFLGI